MVVLQIIMGIGSLYLGMIALKRLMRIGKNVLNVSFDHIEGGINKHLRG